MKNYDFYQNRKHAVIALVFIFFICILIKLFFVQIINSSYKISAENNVIRKIIQYPERGWIYDRNNHLLVSNQRAQDIMIVPYQMEKDLDISLICKTFNISISDFKKRLQAAKKYSNYRPSVFMKGVTKEDFVTIHENLHLFKGFYAQPKYVREYATNSSGNIFGYISQITNSLIKKNPTYTKHDLIGVSGIEKMYEEFLKGEKGVERKVVDVFGKYQGSFQEGRYDTLAKSGKDIQLTIDFELQRYAEKLMSKKRGSVVAIEPSSGEILTLVSSPTFDSSLFLGEKRGENFRKLYLDPGKPLYNRAISAAYPPGSIFKLINALIALQENQITPGTLFKCNQGWNYKSSLHVGCHKHKSPLNLRQAIAQSCNAYFCSTFQRIINKKKTSSEGLNNWHNHAASFGLNTIFNNDFYNNKHGFLPTSQYYDKMYGTNRWRSSTCISLGIGQDAILMTPIQMANIAAIIANRGYYKLPHIIKKINNIPAIEINKDFNTKKYCSIEPQYFKAVIYGMQTAVEGKYGTAPKAKISDITICGKTGTAQNPHGDDHSIFIAFAPKNNPQIAIAVYVENGGWGSDIAAPIASLCIEKYINKKISREILENTIISKNINY